MEDSADGDPKLSVLFSRLHSNGVLICLIHGEEPHLHLKMLYSSIQLLRYVFNISIGSAS